MQPGVRLLTTTSPCSFLPYFPSHRPHPPPSLTSTQQPVRPHSHLTMASLPSSSASTQASSSRRPSDSLVKAPKPQHHQPTFVPIPSRHLTPESRKKAEVDIRRKLALLANVPRPLSPTLPPSPPLSPRPPKRKSPDVEQPSRLPSAELPDKPTKRPRISPQSASISSLAAVRLKPDDRNSVEDASLPTVTLSNAPKEDGELDEALPSVPSRSQGPPRMSTPPRPTRQRRQLSPEQMTSIATRLLSAARELKHSGDKRPQAAPTSRRNIIRLLEHTDALMHFMYAFWCQDECRPAPTTDPWTTLEAFASVIRSSWEKLMSSTEASPDQIAMARIFFGLTLLLKYCAEHRTNRQHTRRLRHESVPPAPSNNSNRGGGSSSVSPANTASSHPTPPSTMSSTPHPPNFAPSPASSASSGNHINSHMTGLNPLRGLHASQSQSPPQQVTVSPSFVNRVHKTLNSAAELQNLLNQANRYLNLYDLRKYFPQTYKVCAGLANAGTGRPLTSGAPHDMHQVDFDTCVKGLGEWAWPILSGDDVVHAVGFGRSLIWEMGGLVLADEGGYRGLAGTWK